MIEFQRDLEAFAAAALEPAMHHARPPMTVATLAHLLYQNVYTRNVPYGGFIHKPFNDVGQKKNFGARLERANTSRLSRARVDRLEAVPGGVRAFKQNRDFGVHPHAHVRGPDAAGHYHLLRNPTVPTDHAWYYVLGEEWSDSYEEPTTRFYWALTPFAAPAAIERVSSILNRVFVPFTFKVLRDPQHYGRCDAGVLYIPSYCLQEAARHLSEIRRPFARYLRPLGPRLTLQVAPGLGAAEDPGRGQSFGLDRCTKIAQAILRSFAEGETASGILVQAVAEGLRAEGVDPDHPYLSSAENLDKFKALAQENWS